MDGYVKLEIIQVVAQKTIVHVLQIQSLQDKRCGSDTIQSPPILFTNPKTSPTYLKSLVSIVKILALRAQKSFQKDLAFFPQAFEMSVFYLAFSGNSYILIQVNSLKYQLQGAISHQKKNKRGRGRLKLIHDSHFRTKAVRSLLVSVHMFMPVYTCVLQICGVFCLWRVLPKLICK